MTGRVLKLQFLLKSTNKIQISNKACLLPMSIGFQSTLSPCLKKMLPRVLFKDYRNLGYYLFVITADVQLPGGSFVCFEVAQLICGFAVLWIKRFQTVFEGLAPEDFAMFTKPEKLRHINSKEHSKTRIHFRAQFI